MFKSTHEREETQENIGYTSNKKKMNDTSMSDERRTVLIIRKNLPLMSVIWRSTADYEETV